MAQSVGRPTSAQVWISRFVSSSPTSGSVLTAQSLEPPSDSVSLSFCPPLSKMNIKFFFFFLILEQRIPASFHLQGYGWRFPHAPCHANTHYHSLTQDLQQDAPTVVP